MKTRTVSEVGSRILLIRGWRNEIRVVKQLGYMCLTLTHVAFDFQCEVQKNFIMTQLLRDVYMKERVFCGGG